MLYYTKQDTHNHCDWRNKVAISVMVWLAVSYSSLVQRDKCSPEHLSLAITWLFCGGCAFLLLCCSSGNTISKLFSAFPFSLNRCKVCPERRWEAVLLLRFWGRDTASHLEPFQEKSRFVLQTFPYVATTWAPLHPSKSLPL